MIFSFLKNFEGAIEVNGELIDNEMIEDYEEKLSSMKIKLTPRGMLNIEYKLVVKYWMCKGSEQLDFHQRWNNGVAMPANEMYGKILSETLLMYKMELHDAENKNKWTGYVSKSSIISMEEVSGRKACNE